MQFFFRTRGSLKAWRLDQFEILHLSLLETWQYFRSLKKLFDLTVGLQVCILIILLTYSALTEKPFHQIKQQSSFGSKSSCLLWVPVMLSNGDIKLLSPRYSESFGRWALSDSQSPNGSFLFEIAGWCWKLFLRCSVVASPVSGLSHISCHFRCLWLVCVNAFDEGILCMVFTLCNTNFTKELVLHVVQIWIQGSIFLSCWRSPCLVPKKKV